MNVTERSLPLHSRASLLSAFIGGLGLFAFGVYGFATASSASPRYAVALVALGLAGVGRAVASHPSFKALDHVSRYLTGAAFGLLAAGLFS